MVGTRHITIEFTSEDIGAFEKVNERINAMLPELIASETMALATPILASLKAGWEAESRQQKKEFAGFRERLSDRWQEPIESLSMMVTIAREFSENTGSRLLNHGNANDRHLVDVITRLHARACQVAAEVLTLISAGFADGAIARWRTLHEIAITALLIKERGDAQAEKYLIHNVVESKKAMEFYQTHADRLGVSPMSDAEVAAINTAYADARDRFGDSFTSSYGWAAQDRTTPVRGFDHLERMLEMGHWRPYYKLASHSVHANPKGVLYQLGLIPERRLLVTGPTDYGFADPGQNAAHSLLQVSTTLGCIEPTLDDLVILNILSTLATDIGESFVRVQRQVEEVSADANKRTVV
jgi:hypothetical protein